MVREVIDLLSSSPVRVQHGASDRGARGREAVQAQLTKMIATTRKEERERERLVVVLESDDDDGGDMGLGLPALKQVAGNKGAGTSTVNGKANQSLGMVTKISTANGKTVGVKETGAKISAVNGNENTNAKGGNDFFFLEDDFDSSVNLDYSVNLPPPPPSTGLLGLDRKRMEEERLARMKRKADLEGGNTNGTRFGEASSKKRKSSLSPLRGNGSFDFGQSLFEKRKGGVDASVLQSSDPFASSPAKPQPKAKPMDIGLIPDDSDDDPFDLSFPLPKKQPAPKLPVNGYVPKASGYKRSVSNIETSAKVKPKIAGLVRSKSTIVESDPILFTSSPDHRAEAKKKRKEKRMKTVNEGDSDEDIFGLDSPKVREGKGIAMVDDSNSDEDVFGLRSPKNDSRFDSGSDDSFPDIDRLPTAKYPLKHSLPKATSSKPKTSKFASQSSAPKASLSKAESALAKYNAEKEKEKRAEDRKNKTAERALEKEADKERKRLAKEEKVREKENQATLAKVNTLKTDKKVSTPEMIVDLPSSLDQKLSRATRTFLETLSVKVFEYESLLPVIKWRREVGAIYDEDLRQFIPCDKYIKKEKHVMYVMPAKEFVKLALGEEGNDIDSHILHLKTKFEECELIYMIEGLAPWHSKNRNIKNNSFQDAVRSQISTVDNASKKKRKPEVYVDEDIVDNALLRLQVVHRVLIHHSRVMNDTSEWIRSFTQHISTIPYKLQQRSLDTAFCMEPGQGPAGTTPEDTFIKMLDVLKGVTPPIAHGIMREYPTVGKLVEGLKKEGPLALAQLRTAANKDGSFADRRVGQAVSRRVYTVFTSRDEGRDDI